MYPAGRCAGISSPTRRPDSHPRPVTTPRRILLLTAIASALGAWSGASAQDGAALLGPLVRGLGTSARVLVIAAHPDDENTQLIAWLARGRQVETAYLSLTRGDGGQNIIGNELGEALGVIRTEELLAARRVDGGRQYFTRAFDFGFSKTAEETLTQWARDSILRDVVTVVRAFRPHVIVSVFSGTPADGHGHHQVAGILARDAYDQSGDTVRFPAAATAGLAPWTVSKFYRSANFRMQERATLQLNVGEYDALLGRSYAELAAISRSQHRSQAMGSLQPRGVRIDRLLREAARAGPDDARAERSLFDGVDTTWNRFRPLMRTVRGQRALDSLRLALQSARASLDVFAPSALVPALGQVMRLLDVICHANDGACADARSRSTAGQGWRDLATSAAVVRRRAERALALATGVFVEATVSRAVWATGERAPVAVAVYNRGGLPLRVQRLAVAPDVAAPSTPVTVLPDSVLRDTLHVTFVEEPTQPWWLTRPRHGAMFAGAERIPDESDAAAPVTLRASIEVQGVVTEVVVPVTYRYADPVRGEINLPASSAPALAVTLDRDVEYARAGVPIERTIRVHVRSHAAVEQEADVRLVLPSGLVSDSAVRRVRVPAGAQRTVAFPVRGRLAPGRHQVRATVVAGAASFSEGYREVAYEHIRPQRLYRPATQAIEAVDVSLPSPARIAYINGVGDNIAPMLEQLGFEVTRLDPAMLAGAALSGFTAVVVGTRAYEANPELVASNARLLDYARTGGTLVVQYGQYEMLAAGIMPYPITLARPADRVTVEGSPVTLLDSAAAVLTAPNRITARDFEGWVQDRSLYMPRTHDPAYDAVIALADPGMAPNDGGVLVAPLGRGTYVYTTLAFFRQLPEGVPGAARLFVNLIAARAARVVP